MNRTLITALTAALVMLVGLSTPAYAVTPAGTLSITVTVTHAESGTEPLTSSTGFTVGLVPAAPKLSAPVNQKVEQNAEEGSVTYEYTITSNANGPASYQIVDPDPEKFLPGVNLVGTPTVVVESPTGGVLLGATAASSESETNDGYIWFSVPSDGVADEDDPDNTGVNGIAPGDQVVIKGNVFEIAQVEDDGVTAQITLMPSDAGDGFSVSVGDLVAEQTSFNLTITGLELDDPNQLATLQVELEARAVSDESLKDKHTTVTSVYVHAEPDLEVYVRNSTGTGNPDDSDNTYQSETYGALFYPTGEVNAVPGDILVYAIVQKAGTSEPLLDTVIRATMPPFASYKRNSTRIYSPSMTVPMVVPDPTPGISPLIDGLDVGTIATFGKREVTFAVQMNESSQEDTELPSYTLWVAGTTDKNVCWDLEVCNSWPYGTCLIDSTMCNDYGCWVEGTSSFDGDIADVYSYIEAEGAANFYTTFGFTTGTQGIDRSDIFCID